MSNDEPFRDGILCTKCEGQAVPLGKIGNLNYYKCTDCGMDYAYEHKEDYEKV
jgi:tRNA(Ile2) C34 agmatinyltransferase TiaS